MPSNSSGTAHRNTPRFLRTAGILSLACITTTLGGCGDIAKNLGDYSRLPVLVGDDAPTNADAVIKMLASEPKLAEQVAAAVRVGGRRWNIEFKNGVSVALPEDDATGAWHRLAAIEKNHRILERRVTLVDLRLPDRVYLRLPPELMPKPPKPGRKENPV